MVVAFFGLSLNLISFAEESADLQSYLLGAPKVYASSVNKKNNSASLFPKAIAPLETDSIIVKYKDSVSTSKRQNIEKEEKLKKKNVIEQLNIIVYDVDENDTGREVVDRMKHSRSSDIEFIEVDMKIAPDLIPNDPLFGNQWHHSNVQTAMAWDTTLGEGITVAILDTGVSPHTDLVFSPVQARNFYNGTTDVTDVYGHGTQVAGTAAAVGNNAIGVSGISPRTLVLPLKISGDDGFASFSTMASALTYAADNGARVANISFGACGSDSVQSAASYLRSKGGVVVVSAGNSNLDNGTLAHSSMTCVSATNSSDVKTSWSSFGAYVDVTAPGLGIYTTTHTGGYGAVSGTSFSSPLTAGVYALLFSVNPQLSVSQVDSILFQTADDLGDAGWDKYYGYGRVNAARAVAMAASTTGSGGVDREAPSSPVNLVASGLTATQVTLSWNPSTDNVAVTDYDLYRNSVKIATVSGNMFTNTGLTSNTSYTYAVAARDAAGNTSAQSTSIAVLTPSAPFAITSMSVLLKTGTTATINSTTNQPATVVVKYGLLSTSLTMLTAGPSVFGTSHAVNLAGLKAKTKYFYQVIATKENGEVTASAISSFRTPTR